MSKFGCKIHGVYYDKGCPECRSAWKTTNLFYFTPEWIKLRDKFRSDHPNCIVCGAPMKHVHHIKPVKSHPELALNPDNLISVCEDCHKLIHYWRKRKRAIELGKMRPKNKNIYRYL